MILDEHESVHLTLDWMTASQFVVTLDESE